MNIWGVLAVLVVLAVIFFGFVIPVINSARRAAYPNMCRMKIRQLALAAITFEEANRGFPALYFRKLAEGEKVDPRKVHESDPTLIRPHYSWIVRVLPYIEEKHVFDQVERNSKEFTLEPNEIMVTELNDKQVAAKDYSIAGLTCQYSSNDDGKFRGTTHFVAMTATKQQLITVGELTVTLADGVIVPSSQAKTYRGTSIAAIRDGVSKTILLAETNEDERSNWFHWQQTFVCGFLPGDTSVPDHDPLKGIPRIDLNAEKDKQWIFNTKVGNRTALMSGSPDEHRKSPYNADQNDPLRRTLGPSSEHSNNMVLHVNADGSIREIDVKSVDPRIYYHAISRHDWANTFLVNPDLLDEKRDLLKSK